MKRPAKQIPSEVSTVLTSRLDVAAFLLVKAFSVARVDVKQSTVTFTFHDPTGNGESEMLEFYRGAQVRANEFADAQKRIRDLMWEAKRRNPDSAR